MMRTLFGERLARHATTAGMAPAGIGVEREIGYAELLARVEALAAWLVADAGAGRGAVGVSIADERANLVASLALLVLGVPQVTLPTTDPRPLREDLARRLAVERVLADVPGQDLDGVPAMVVPAALRTWGECPGGPRIPVAALVDDPDAPALYITSSGTTGRPKILAYTQRALRARANIIAEIEAFGPDTRIVVPMSMQSFAGKTTRLYAVHEGVTAAIHDDSANTADAILSLCLGMRATIVHLTVLQATNLVAAERLSGRLPPSVMVVMGATRLPAGLRADFERRVGGRLYDRYGATEVGIVSTTYPRGDEGVPDSVGRVAAGVVLEIVDADGRPVPPGTVGELRVRTPWMTTGYVDDPDTTARQFRDGWFRPGDMAAVTVEGVVRFLGRKDDMMSLNGINIFPAEIERVLDAHPAVKESAAFPVRSALFGDIPLAAVELRVPDGAVAADLLAYAREQLGVRAPRKIAIVGTLPRNVSGKVLKLELAKRFAGGRLDA